MFGIVRSELLKMRHSFSMKLIFAAPLATVLVGFLLSSHVVQYSAYNWWYTMLLPVVTALWAAGTVIREKNTGLQNIVCLPFPSAKIWIGKGLTLTAVLFISNLLMWLFTTGIASFTTMNISPLDSIIGWHQRNHIRNITVQRFANLDEGRHGDMLPLAHVGDMVRCQMRLEP